MCFAIGTEELPQWESVLKSRACRLKGARHVTGAGRGLGFAYPKLLAQRDAHVVLHDV